jgi:uncharacterized surface protein with fasciclin (FAS1) repeats
MQWSKVMVCLSVLALSASCDPPEAFSISLVLGACGTSQHTFSTPSACKIFSAARATELVDVMNGYTILLPYDSQIAAYLSKNGMTLDNFIQSKELMPFVKKHVFVGVIKSNQIVTNLLNKTYQVENIDGKLSIESNQLTSEYPSEKIMFFSINKVLD